MWTASLVNGDLKVTRTGRDTCQWTQGRITFEESTGCLIHPKSKLLQDARAPVASWYCRMSDYFVKLCVTRMMACVSEVP